jgi:FeS assembly SUF system protein
MSSDQARPNPAAAGDLRERVVAALRTVYDPEIPVNVHDLGLIYGLDLGEDGAGGAEAGATVRIRMTLTAPNCPMADVIVRQVENAVRAVEGVGAATVEIVWEPKWDPSLMSEAAKLELEFTGHAGPAHLRRDRFSSLTVGRTPPPPGKDRKP